MKKLFNHPLTQTTRRIVRRVVATCAVIIAVAFVTTVTRRSRPVAEGARRKGRIRLHGPADAHRPHVGASLARPLRPRGHRHRRTRARAIARSCSPSASTCLDALVHAVQPPRRLRCDRDDRLADVRRDVPGRHAITSRGSRRQNPRGPSAWTTTLQYVRASRGRVHLRGPRDAVERRHAEPRRHRRAAEHRVPRAGELLQRHRHDPELRADARRHAHDVQDRRRQGGARSDRPDDRRRRVAAHRAGRSDAVAGAALLRAVEGRPAADARDLLRRRRRSRCQARATSTAPSTCSARP